LAAAAVVLAAAGLAVRVLDDSTGPQVSPSGVFPPAEPTVPAATAKPKDAPFPGPDTSLSEEQQLAVKVVTQLSFAGGLTKVHSVELTTYNDAMCGRVGSYVPSDRPVWMVWFEGPFRTFIPSGVGGVPPPEPPAKMHVVDAISYVSQQSFAPWPLPRDPSVRCPPDGLCIQSGGAR
jgi:hypothetical protein